MMNTPRSIGKKNTLCQKLLARDGSIMIDVIVSMFVLTLGFTGSLALVVASTNANHNQKSRLIATNLAAEGLEVVRNMRDTNWLTYPSDLRECWNFWEDTNEDGFLDDTSDETCVDVEPDGQNDHPIGYSTELNGSAAIYPQKFIVDFDPATFRWNLIPENLFNDFPQTDPNDALNIKDYTDGYQLFREELYGGNDFYTHNKHDAVDRDTDGDVIANGDAIENPSAGFSRELSLYYIDSSSDGGFDDSDADRDNWTGGEYNPSEPSEDNRILIISRVTWNMPNGSIREVVLSTIMTDYYNRSEWNS